MKGIPGCLRAPFGRAPISIENYIFRSLQLIPGGLRIVRRFHDDSTGARVQCAANSIASIKCSADPAIKGFFRSTRPIVHCLRA
jgi:hypothetical protein